MKYIIGVDVDSVLRDFPHDLVRVIKREHPEWYNEDYPVPDQWEMEKCFNPNGRNKQYVLGRTY